MNGPTYSGEISSRRDARHPSVEKTEKRRFKLPRKKYVFYSVVVFVLVAVAVVMCLLFVQSRLSNFIDGGKYQAVFLTNGQVYFGKLKSIGSDYMSLTDIWYLQNKTSESDGLQETTKDTAASVEIVKLGNEIHGPDDEMIIGKDQILFFENLKQDGSVSKTIIAEKQKQSK